MTWKYLVPEICPHGVDQRYKSRVDDLGCTVTERYSCLKCLAEVDATVVMRCVDVTDIKFDSK